MWVSFFLVGQALFCYFEKKKYIYIDYVRFAQFSFYTLAVGFFICDHSSFGFFVLDQTGFRVKKDMP